MKPIKLTIAGLNSFRKRQEIDFDRLTDAGVFGIFGHTGSGKSTILDAITLALYGKVIRASNGTRGILNHGENSLEVTLQFTLGLGNDRSTYRVDRRYSRGDKDAVKNTVSRLVAIDRTGQERILEEGANAVTRAIENLLGIHCDDFTRAVVLPQGKFAEFLSLSGKDRRAMLQRLFNLEQYGRHLSERLSRRSSLVTEERLNVEGELAGLGDASPEAINRAQAALEAAQAEEQRSKKKLDKLQKAVEEAREVCKLQNQLAVKTEQVEAHQSQAERFRQVQTQVERADEAEKVLPLIVRAERTTEVAAQLAVAKEKAEQQAVAAEATLKAVQARWETAQQLRVTEEPRLIAQQVQLQEAQEVEQQLEGLSADWSQAKTQLAQKQAAAQAAEQDRQRWLVQKENLHKLNRDDEAAVEANQVTADYRRQVDDAKQKGEELRRQARLWEQANKEALLRQQAVAQARSNWEAKGQQAAMLQAEWLQAMALEEQVAGQPPVSEDVLNRLALRLEEVRGLLNPLQERETRRGDLLVWRQKLGEARSQAQAQIASLEKERAELERAVKGQREALLDLALQNKRALAAHLAADLHPGAPCPVCGSLDHPHPALADVKVIDIDESEEKAQREQALALSEEKLAKVQKAEENWKQQFRADEARLELLDKDLAETVAAIIELRQQANERWPGKHPLGLPLDPAIPTAEQLQQQIALGDRGIGEKREQLAKWQQEREQAGQQLRLLQEKLTTAKAEHQSGYQLVEAAEREWQQSQEVHTQARAELTTAEEAFRQVLALWGEDGQDLLTGGIQKVRERAAAIHRQDQRCETLRRQMQGRVAELAACEEALTQAQAQERTASGEVLQWISLEKGKALQVAALQAKVHQMTGGRKASVLLQTINEQLTKIQHDEKNAHIDVQQAREQREKASEERERQGTLWQVAQGEQATVQEELTAALRQTGFTAVQEVRASLVDNDEKAKLQGWMTEYLDQGKRLQAEWAQLQEQLGGRTLSPEAWERQEALWQEQQQALETATSQRGACEQAYQVITGKQERWQQLKKRQEALAEEGHRLNQLKALLRGDCLVDFLAQEQVEFVAQQASEQLKQMTRNRYALEILDGGFVIRDDANGGVKRPVASLSGGETFQASLALALALSAQIQLQGKYPLEFFFLDEGFGTLDADTLDVVMGTLEQLQTGRRAIGVISHVQELQQRLIRRLMVTHSEVAGSGSQVRIEIG
ncbi:AAA family ATPase [Heliophilum fasciatum]|uniref:Nuclease SbcCD subunit C n=1 Tax=Heliophilum fasciatum TaxID=35700 RepID=A0A4R2RIT0_9FIRM|nr:AAA family ATPase [Heliophilum fasciatum]MCW2278391.1 exonuclease SbcC [Heliophilum fasciatum]TCP63710.1 exonuclease SbcC [Heliophilum fasciatum]